MKLLRVLRILKIKLHIGKDKMVGVRVILIFQGMNQSWLRFRLQDQLSCLTSAFCIVFILV